MRRAFAFAAVLALGVAAFAAAPSCSTETVPVIDTGCPVSGTTPKISIASPADGACVEVASGGDAFIPVVVAVENFKLDPPGACNECEECGHLALAVNGQPNNSSANAVVDLVFGGNIASRYGELELTVTLVGDDGNPWAPAVDGGTGDAGDAGQTAAVKPISATVKITTAKSCGTSTSSSSGTGGAGSSSSSSGTGGAGTGGAGGGMSSSSSSGTGGAGGGMSSSSSSGTGGAGTGGAGTGGAGTGGAGTGGK